MTRPSPRLRPLRRAAAVLAAVALSAPALAGTPTMDQRRAAARETASSNPSCQAIRPFYWSVGDASGVRVDGREGLMAPTARTVLAVASASKMVFGAWVVEQRGGVLSDDDVALLNFTSGWTEFDRCLRDQTVAECQSYDSRRIHNGGYVAAHRGRFVYSGGHLQKLGVVTGLGPDDDAALAAHVNATLGTDFSYVQPQLAGGVRASAQGYGEFLARVVSGRLPHFRDALGQHAVCTNPTTCPTAVYTPVPLDESWHYALGHWVEDDPRVGDGTFSSAGAFGFYPWIDAGRQWWGVVARQTADALGAPDAHRHPGAMSAFCGREIRAAWRDGQPRR